MFIIKNVREGEVLFLFIIFYFAFGLVLVIGVKGTVRYAWEKCSKGSQTSRRKSSPSQSTTRLF